jgi:hypothetical protein
MYFNHLFFSNFYFFNNIFFALIFNFFKVGKQSNRFKLVEDALHHGENAWAVGMRRLAEAGPRVAKGAHMRGLEIPSGCLL